jgi:Fe-S-cluster containining protein
MTSERDDPAADPVLDERDWLAGLRYCHGQLSTHSLRLFEALSYCYALSEALIAKGVAGIEELEARKDAAAQRLAGQFQQQRIGVQMGEERDKYNLEGQESRLDCGSRRDLCRAACCKLDFALSTQDIEEGTVRWRLDQPYMIRKGVNGYCIHLDQEKRQCSIYERRPAICRLYSCRNDGKVWLDYDRSAVNPALVPGEPAGPAEPEEDSHALP